MFKQEIFKSIAYGCRKCRGTNDIKGGAGLVVLADLLPAVRTLRPRQDDPDVLDAAGAVEFGVGGALVGGQGMEMWSGMGDGGRWRGMGWVSGWWGCGCTGRRDATGIQTQCADQGIASDFNGTACYGGVMLPQSGGRKQWGW